MQEKPDQNADEADPVKVDEDLILELNFVPQWARKPPSAQVEGGRGGADRRDRRRGRDTRDYEDFDRRRPSGRGGGDRRQRRPRPDRDRERSRTPRERPQEPVAAPGAETPASRPAYRAESRTENRGGYGRERYERPRQEFIPVYVRFFPDQKQLSAVVRQLLATKRAYPLIDVAGLFFAKPAFACAKIEPAPDAPDVELFQCKLCRSVALGREQIESHIVEAHIGDFFEREDIEGEAPEGQFVCVAKCGISGALLGPPNHHCYAERLQEVHRTRFPSMALDDYRARIVTSRDPELIEQWKEEMRKQTVYRLKKTGDDAPPEPLKWSAAETYMREHVAPDNVARTRRAILTVDVALDLHDSRLARLVQDSWRREKNHPRSLAFALRAALRHKHMHLFKAGRGMEYVTAIAPSPLDPEFTVDEISEVLGYLRDHPGCKRQELVEALRPGQAPNSDEVAKVLQPLAWLVEKGHLIEFFDGSLAVPLGGPESGHP